MVHQLPAKPTQSWPTHSNHSSGSIPSNNSAKRNRKGKNPNNNNNRAAGGGGGNRRLPVPARAFPKFLHLPPEVQKNIFKIAASDNREWSYRSKRTQWVYISRQVREWVEPYLYGSIELPDYSDEGPVNDRELKKLKLFERVFQAKPKEFFTKNVKRIFTSSRPEFGEHSIELELLSVCDNLKTLECWSTPKKALTDILTTKTWPKLKVLCLNLELLPKDENIFRLPIFQNVTHLDFACDEAQLPLWKSLESLKSLTHMRINTMRKLKKRNETMKAVEQACSIATEAQKYLPPNLRHFVILIPIDILYYMCIGSRKPKDEERWKMVESIRRGVFDERIMLGCDGDNHRWFDEGGPGIYGADDEDEDEEADDGDEDEENYMEDFGEYYLHTIPIITYPTQPRDDSDSWEDVEGKNKPGKRKTIGRWTSFDEIYGVTMTADKGEDEDEDEDEDGDENDSE